MKKIIRIFIAVGIIIVGGIFIYNITLTKLITKNWHPKSFNLETIELYDYNKIVIELSSHSCQPFEVTNADELNKLINYIRESNFFKYYNEINIYITNVRKIL